MSDETTSTDEPSASPLELDDVEANFELLEHLHLEDLLSERAYERARARLWPPERAWWWFDRGLLSIGTILVLVGLVFLFAYNWAAVPKFAKFAFVEMALAGSLIGAWSAGWTSRGGRAGLFAASIFVGIFLAVFGQVYQTGADSWELFAGWAALIAGWVALGRSVGLGLFWLGLLHVGTILHTAQTHPHPDHPELAIAFWCLGGVDALALAAREWGAGRVDWLDATWPRWLLVSATLGMFWIVAWGYLGMVREHHGTTLISVALWGLAVGASYLYFRHGTFDRVALALTGIAGLSIPVWAAIRWSGEWLFEWMPAFSLLVAAVVFFAATGLLVLWLRHLPDPEQLEEEAS
jgi:uncharacterized membrane protein